MVVADQRFKRDGRFLEKVGTFDPLPDSVGTKHVTLNLERLKYWLSVGAQPSDPVRGSGARVRRNPVAVHIK